MDYIFNLVRKKVILDFLNSFKYQVNLHNIMNKKVIIFGLILLSLFLIGCGEKGPVCNSPYIVMGNGCCLDKDSNSICDKDEGLSAEKDKEELKSTAELFAVYYEAGDYEKLYDMSTPERRSQRSKGDFIKLANQKFGKDGAYGLEYRDALIDGEKGYVTYYESYLGEESISPKYYFKNVEGDWYFNGFTLAFMFGCFKEAECIENEYLLDACQETCVEQDQRLRPESEKKFRCYKNSCSCVCWDDEKESGTVTEPDIKFVHQDE